MFQIAWPCPTDQTMNLTQEEIRRRRDELLTQARRLAARHKKELASIRADREFLQSECSHPDKYTRSIMGRETVVTCPDCGWEQ